MFSQNLPISTAFTAILKNEATTMQRNLFKYFTSLICRKSGCYVLYCRLYNTIKPKQKQPPRIYGLPKIHKPKTPLRPIVSCINTFAYDLSAYLANILSPLTGKSDYSVINSLHFVSTFSHEKVHDDEVTVSFDVESLFTNVPIESAVQTAFRKLENDSGLANRTNLTPTQIADLLNFVLRSTYFQYNGSIYEQQDRAAMGSPVSAVIAKIYKEEFEKQAITNATCKPNDM